MSTANQVVRLTYCRRCLLPSTKPYIRFDDDGVCQACRNHELKHQALDGINWAERSAQFDAIVEAAKAKKAPMFDALVPVSGGKDSITQVDRLLGRGLRILAVNIDYGIKTEIGHYNLARIPEMGANLFIYRPELKLHKEMIRLGLEQYGDPDLLSHTLLHAGPLHLALKFEIPLVLLGENSAEEYGGDESIANADGMTRAWFASFAANSGHDARYISKKHDIPFEYLKMYDFPDEIEDSATKAVFMSRYFKWDSEEHLRIAESHGFKKLDGASEGTFRSFVGLDEKINRIHQYMKVLKFGYGRASDHACEDIRAGRISREEGKRLIREHDLTPLSDHFIDDFADFVGYDREELVGIIESFRDESIWQKDEAGRWFIPNHLEDLDHAALDRSGS